MYEILTTGGKDQIQRAWEILAWSDPSPALAVDHQELHFNKWQLRGYCESQEHGERAKSLVHSVLPALQISIAPVADIDWVQKSLEGLPPVSSGKFVIVGEHTRDLVIGGKTPLLIEAGTAFGTGHHGTTLGALNALQQINRQTRPKTLLDVGTGTGVLAIAAAKMGIAHITASDIDTEAVDVARANSELNACRAINFVQSRGVRNMLIQNQAPYNLICANIIAPVLKPLSQDLPKILSPNGHIILSGLLKHQVSSTLTHYRRRGLKLLQRSQIDAWYTLVMQK